MFNIKQIIEIVLASVLAICLAAFIRIAFFQTFVVSNKSMEPTFKEGDKILLLKNNFIFNNAKNFDVIVFKNKDSNLIKRVIGVEGDKVQIKDGGLYLNDKLIEHDFYVFPESDNMVYTVEKDKLFVLGDNILDSEDSRYFGTIYKTNMIGKVFLIFNPRDHFRIIRK